VEPSEPSPEWGVESVRARLFLWCCRPGTGIALVEFVDELVRQELVRQLRASLENAGGHFAELTLIPETRERPVADDLLERLQSLPAGTISVDGFADSFPIDKQELAQAIYRLSFKRELLATTGQHQIWWMPGYLASILERIAPDLTSWILLKLKLTTTAAELGLPGQLPPGMTERRKLSGALSDGLRSAADPVDVRRRARDAMSRFKRALGQGIASREAFDSLMVPAIALMRHADLAQEAEVLELQAREELERHAIQELREKSPLISSTQPETDVFISYAAPDLRWARWLDFILREAGYSTVLQHYDFTVGESFVNAMHSALGRSRLVVCLYSPAYLGSSWCKEEALAALYTDRLFPVRVAECSPDGLLGPRAYSDVVGRAENIATDLILTELRKRLGQDPRPDVKPTFPETAPTSTGPSRAAPVSSQRPPFPGSLPPIWNITEERNPYFTGRDEALDRMHRALTAGNTAALTQAIMGLGGVGKTQLALEYAYRYAGEYDAVWWLHAEEPVALARDYVALASHLGIAEVADQERTVSEVRQALSHRQRTLLVFDNATAPSAIKPYLPVGQGRRVIVTTRAHTWPGATSQDVNELSLESAIEFLLRRTNPQILAAEKAAAAPEEAPGKMAAAEDIATRLGCLPLALEQAAAYVETCGKTLADYAALLKKRGLAVLEKGAPHGYEQTVGTTWALAFEQVQASCPAAAELLDLCAFLAPDAIYVDELGRASQHLPDKLVQTLGDEVALDEAKASLLGFSLMRLEGKAISIHRLVQEVTRERMDPETRNQWLVAAVRTVNALFPDDSDDVRTWPLCSRWLVHAVAVVNRKSAAELDASACSRLLNQAALYLQHRADYAKAEPLFRRARAIDEANYGPDHPKVAVRLNNLAELLRATNRLAEAEPLFRRALRIWEDSYGEHHPQVATALNNLAGVLYATNRFAEAEPLFRRARAIDEANYGPDHPNLARDLNNLAELLRATNRPAEAELLYRRALAINEVTYGPNHPSVARDLNNLAELFRDTNQFAEAEPLYRRALSIFETSFGSEHPHTVTCRKNLERLLGSLKG
jgi:tetratricopeptide (TPR) repeat protein